MKSLLSAILLNFLGRAPVWYKKLIITFLLINPLAFLYDPFISGWLLVVQFIFILAMTLKCYPLQPGGLITIEAITIGMASPKMVIDKIEMNIDVILLLIFMVAGIYFVKDLLLFLLAKVILKLRSKIALSIVFCFICSLLSAFLDALTIMAAVITISTGLYGIYHQATSNESDATNLNHENDLKNFRGFLRNIMMHAGIGTALGGVSTMVSEPQNLIIAAQAQWNFITFIKHMAPITISALSSGLLICYIVERTKSFGYGYQMPEHTREILNNFIIEEQNKRTLYDKVNLFTQSLVILWLIMALILQVAAIGLIGLSVIILATSLNGIVDEHQLGKAFTDALPFTALLTVFFAVIAIILNLHLFTPIIQWALNFNGDTQVFIFYLANAILSMISDNVFVGTIYIDEAKEALIHHKISEYQFERLAIAINTGTNLPSVATPNGQAAFLFLLTSTLSPLIKLTYGRMVQAALPYTIVLSIVGAVISIIN